MSLSKFQKMISVMSWKVTRLTKVQIAWLAGLIDGEGCISIVKGKPKGENKSTIYYLSLAMNMIDKPTIKLVQKLTGGSVCKRVVRGPNKRTFYSWTLTCQRALELLRIIKPYSITKATQVRLGIEFQSRIKPNGHRLLTASELKIRDNYYTRMRQLKRREWK